MPLGDWLDKDMRVRTDLGALPDEVIASILYGPSITDSDVRQPHPKAVSDAFLEELLGAWQQQSREDPFRAMLLGRQLFGQGTQSETGNPLEHLGRLLFPQMQTPVPQQSPLARALLGQL